MSVIQRIVFQRKSFSTVFYKVYQRRILTVVQQIKQNSNVCFCSSKSSGATIKEKCCVSESSNTEKSNWSKSLTCILDENLMIEDLEKSDLTVLTERFGLKGLTIQHIEKYNVKISFDLTTLLFPFDSLDRKVSALQTMFYNAEGSGDGISSKFSSGSNYSTLFGWSLVNPNEKCLVVTSDPLDAIAVNQTTDIAAVALPCNFTEFSPEVLNALKSFKRVIFWLNPNLGNWELNKLLGDFLEQKGYFIWSENPQSAMFHLQNNSSIANILKEAYPLYDKSLATVDVFKDAVWEQLMNQQKIVGVKWKKFAPLNDLLKGHRKGELTVFSGQTGTGKTTFLSDYSLDLCMQGLPTLWASFEIQYAKLIKTMLSQFSLCPPDEIDSVNYENWVNKFRKLPMFFLMFQDCYSSETILNKMLSAVRLYKVQHIVIDNLQFLNSYMDDYVASQDHLRRQDSIYSAFRDFATHMNCHITLVIHPRKEPDFFELNMLSISGTAKATQEADNVLILQTTKTRQYLQVTKNRFDGQKGCILLEFDRKTYSFSMRAMNTKEQDSKENSGTL